VRELSRPVTIRLGVRSVIIALASLMILLAGPGQGHGYAASPNDNRDDPGGGAQASIIGGKTASIASYPWLAYILYQGPVDEFSCGGTVVSPRLILTAAHCVLTGTGKVAVASNFSVLTGVGNLKEATPERVSRVSQVLVFPGYEPSRVLNDAALLVLTEPVGVPPLPLATPSDEALLAKGVPVAVAGWGLIDVEPPQLPAVLREAQSVVQSPPYCQRSLGRVLSAYASGSQICVRSQSGSGVSLCDGDSGGPGIARRPDGTPVQIGIISLKGSLDCDPRSPQVLARVDRVSSWVAAWTAAIELGAPTPKVVVPAVELPRVTRRDAEVFAWLGLEADFGSQFSGGRYHRIGCRRVNREKVKCGVQWLRGIDFYRGAITIYAALPREGFIYNYRYTIRRFNVNCWLTYLHPIQACNPRIFKR
jgi:hypothetical protein